MAAFVQECSGRMTQSCVVWILACPVDSSMVRAKGSGSPWGQSAAVPRQEQGGILQLLFRVALRDGAGAIILRRRRITHDVRGHLGVPPAADAGEDEADDLGFIAVAQDRGPNQLAPGALELGGPGGWTTSPLSQAKLGRPSLYQAGTTSARPAAADAAVAVADDELLAVLLGLGHEVVKDRPIVHPRTASTWFHFSTAVMPLKFGALMVVGPGTVAPA